MIIIITIMIVTVMILSIWFLLVITVSNWPH